jgi:hypothetical protein
MKNTRRLGVAEGWLVGYCGSSRKREAGGEASQGNHALIEEKGWD